MNPSGGELPVARPDLDARVADLYTVPAHVRLDARVDESTEPRHLGSRHAYNMAFLLQSEKMVRAHVDPT